MHFMDLENEYGKKSTTEKTINTLKTLYNSSFFIYKIIPNLFFILKNMLLIQIKQIFMIMLLGKKILKD